MRIHFLCIICEISIGTSIKRKFFGVKTFRPLESELALVVVSQPAATSGNPSNAKEIRRVVQDSTLPPCSSNIAGADPVISFTDTREGKAAEAALDVTYVSVSAEKPLTSSEGLVTLRQSRDYTSWESAVPRSGFPESVVCNGDSYKFSGRNGSTIYMTDSSIHREAELLIENDCTNSHRLSKLFDALSKLTESEGVSGRPICLSPLLDIGWDSFSDCDRSRQMLLVEKPGISLFERMAQLGGEIPLAELCSTMIHLLESVRLAHSSGVYGLSISPSSVFLPVSGRHMVGISPTLKLCGPREDLQQVFMFMGSLNSDVYNILLSRNGYDSMKYIAIKQELEILKRIVFSSNTKVKSSEYSEFVEQIQKLGKLVDTF